jgi:hypothetical protein
MADIHALPTREKQRNDFLIERLEELLVQARSGDIESMLAVVFRPIRGRFFTVDTGCVDGLLAIGSLETLKHDLLTAMEDGPGVTTVPPPDAG